MPTINLTTNISAPINRVFDLSRSIDLHKISTKKTNEVAIAGIKNGVIGHNQTVTWQAKHLGLIQTMTSLISEFNSPNLFVDEMTDGPFKSLHHQHKFSENNGVTSMQDILKYESPFGIIGKLFNNIYLTNYLTKLLIHRNNVIKDFAVSDKWKSLKLN